MKILAKNKKIYFDYEIIDTRDAGIILQWHEVKSIKLQKAVLADAIVKIDEKEIWLINMDISLYKWTHPNTVPGYNPKGRRKLLLTKKQLGKLRSQIQKTGLHIVPLEVYADRNRRIKVKIGLAKRKRKIEKRSSIRERDIGRQMDREIRDYRK